MRLLKRCLLCTPKQQEAVQLLSPPLHVENFLAEDSALWLKQGYKIYINTRYTVKEYKQGIEFPVTLSRVKSSKRVNPRHEVGSKGISRNYAAEKPSISN